jgi:hypothetical protein
MRYHPTVTKTRHGSVRDQGTSSSPATLSDAHPNELAARRAVAALQAVGVPRHDIRLLIGRPLHDTRHEPVGGWAGPLRPDAPVGTFGGGARLRRRGPGSYAGDPDQQRQGSWADVERVVIVTYKDGSERSRITGLRGGERFLRTAALDDDAIERAVDDLQLGRTVVLVDVTEIALRDVQAQLEQVGQAA